MLDSILKDLPDPVINAVGYATRVGGSCPSPKILQVMQWAQEHYFEMDDLFEYSSRVIARATGSEAGIVTCSASAGLTLGAAAIMAGDDIEIMEVLPDTSHLKRRTFLYPESSYFDYDHPVRAAGAGLRFVEFAGEDIEKRLSAACTEDVAGVVCVWKHRDDSEMIRRVSQVCRQAEIPLLLDAAMGLPPSENLREIMAWKPNLVTLSGGKHLGGPQNSGLLFGDAALIRSAWLQMADMDVRPASWSLAHLLNQKVLNRPPRHGVGRGFKVGKDAILGCLAALELYSSRDFAVERERWREVCRNIVDGLGSNRSFAVEGLRENGTGQYPVVKITADGANKMNRFKEHLKSQLPKILMAEDEENEEVAYIYPMCLSDAELPTLIGRMIHAMNHES